jgi:hypothetical protein
MKKYIPVLLFFICIKTIYPQTFRLSVQPGVTLGKMIPLKTAFNETGQINVSDPLLLNDERMMTGGQMAIRATCLPVKWMSFQAGLDYLQQGGIYKNYDGEFYQKAFRNHYLGIPLEINLLSHCRISIFGGYEASVLLVPSSKIENPFHLNRLSHSYFYGIGVRLWDSLLKISHYRSISPEMTFSFNNMGKVDYYYEGFNFSLEITIRSFPRKKPVVNP